jgi:hypothetical protein
VGKITEIAHDENKIYATKSEHTNPLIAELFSRGELEAYSTVAPFSAEKSNDSDADFVLKRFNGINRMDYVDEGGCADCKTGIVPDDMILTAKLSMEVNNMGKKIEITQEELDALKKKEKDFDNLQTKYDKGADLYNKGKTKFEELQKEEQDLRGQLIPVWTKANPDTAIEARMAKIEKEAKEAKLEAKKAQDTMMLEAKKTQYGSIVDKAIEDNIFWLSFTDLIFS